MKDFNKVFNIGFYKAGTCSLTEALNLLSIKSIHYNCNKKSIHETMGHNKENNNKLLTGLEEFRGFSDFNGRRYYKKLDKQYPNSKFILTVRDMDSWIKSRKKHSKLYLNERKKINKTKEKKKKEKIIRNTKQYFKDKPENLLIINIPAGDGWEKLCPFLGVEIPDVPFPHANKTSIKMVERILGRIGIFLNKYFLRLYLSLKEKK